MLFISPDFSASPAEIIFAQIHRLLESPTNFGLHVHVCGIKNGLPDEVIYYFVW